VYGNICPSMRLVAKPKFIRKTSGCKCVSTCLRMPLHLRSS
jgi:hypothetical protein